MIDYLVFNSFSVGSEGGNAAGVVFNAELFSAEQMQAIAAELGFVETVFINCRDINDIRLRYFTPLKELPMTGHPTLAAWSALIYQGIISAGADKEYTVTAPGGVIRIRQIEGIIFLSQSPPTFKEVPSKLLQEILTAFSLSADDVLNNYPMVCVNAGLGHLIFGVKSYEILQKIEPSAEFPALLEKLGVPECQIFTPETLDPANDLHTRNLCLCLRPGEEDPACGNGNAALGGYFLKYDPQGRGEISLRAEQGAVIGQPCLIHIKSRWAEDKSVETFIGGAARYVRSGTLYI